MLAFWDFQIGDFRVEALVLQVQRWTTTSTVVRSVLQQGWWRVVALGLDEEDRWILG